MTPPNLAAPERLPEKWGLVEVGVNGRCRTIIEEQPDFNQRNEVGMLWSVRRTQEKSETKEAAK